MFLNNTLMHAQDLIQQQQLRLRHLADKRRTTIADDTVVREFFESDFETGVMLQINKLISSGLREDFDESQKK